MVARVLFPCTHSLEELDRLPTAGDHKGPPNLSSTTLAPTDRLASCLTSQLRLMFIGCLSMAPVEVKGGKANHGDAFGDHACHPERSEGSLGPLS